jgi:hypothetical protein
MHNWPQLGLIQVTAIGKRKKEESAVADQSVVFAPLLSAVERQHPTFRLCQKCGNILEPVMQKLETLAAVQRQLGLDRVEIGLSDARQGARELAHRNFNKATGDASRAITSRMHHNELRLGLAGFRRRIKGFVCFAVRLTLRWRHLCQS